MVKSCLELKEKPMKKNIKLKMMMMKTWKRMKRKTRAQRNSLLVKTVHIIKHTRQPNLIYKMGKSWESSGHGESIIKRLRTSQRNLTVLPLTMNQFLEDSSAYNTLKALVGMTGIS